MNKSFIIIIASLLLLALVIILSCTLPVGSDHATFSVNIVVTDTLGNPVPDLRVSAMSNLDIATPPTPTVRSNAIPSSQSVLPGDININGIPWEIADYLMFREYFTGGIGAFRDHVDASTIASDTRSLGTTLTIADFMYLRWIVLGNGQRSNLSEPLIMTYSMHLDGWLVIDGYVSCLFLQLEGNQHPILSAVDYELRYDFDGTDTYVLIGLPLKKRTGS